MKPVRLLFAIIGIFLGGIVAGKIMAYVTGYPDIGGILGWDVLFIAMSGAAAYSAVIKK